MNVVISVAEHEIEMSHRWFDFVCELGGTDGHSLFLIPSVNISDSGRVASGIMPKAQKAFNGRVTIIKDEEGETSNWQITEPMRSASGPNSAFRQVAWYFYHNKLGPYFWCELDCIPTKKEWLDKLEAEYKTALANGKVFLGAQVLLESVPEHMSGNAVYPQNVPEEAPTLVMRTNWTPRDQERSFELAFDIAGAAEVIPKAHWTNLIQHKFRYEGFKSRAEFDAVIDPNAVVFHSDKKGTIFPYLRQNLSGGANALTESGGVKTLAKTEIDSEFEPQGSSSARDTAQTTLDKRRAALVKARAARAVKRNLSSVSPKPSTSLRVGPESDTSAQTTVENRTFKTDDELQNVIAQNQVIRNGLPAMSPPWENREDSERDVKMICDALKLFCGSPVYKGRVRQALREAKIIK